MTEVIFVDEKGNSSKQLDLSHMRVESPVRIGSLMTKEESEKPTKVLVISELTREVERQKRLNEIKMYEPVFGGRDSEGNPLLLKVDYELADSDYVAIGGRK